MAHDFIKPAKFRAAAVAYCNTLEDWTKSSDIVEQIMKDDPSLSMTTNRAQVLLRELSEAGFIQGTRKDRLYFYKGKGYVVDVDTVFGRDWKKNSPIVSEGSLEVVKSERRVQPVSRARAPQEEAHMGVDIVKGTGKIRVRVSGFTLEIGVVQE